MTSAHNSDAQGLRQRSTLAVYREATSSAAAVDVPPSEALSVKGEDDATPASGSPATDGVTVEGVHGGKTAALHRKLKNILVLDKIEDALGNAWDVSKVILWPILHSVRFCFGLCLLFYGMAFRTLAFHIIVIRLSGLGEVQRSLAQLGSKYSSARRALREAAAAAEDIGGRLIKRDSLRVKMARDRMIEEKKRLLADGDLTAEQTAAFMKNYNDDLDKIIKEKERFNSARSSILSAKAALDLRDARASLTCAYNALFASFTASTLQTAGRIALGLHIGSLLKTHVLDLFGPILDPVGYRLDLNTYFDEQNISYMGKANAMGGAANMILNIVCYSVVFVLFCVHSNIALKMSMVYYAAKLVTDYVVRVWDSLRRRRGRMPIAQTPWSGCMQAALAFAGWYFHRNALYAAGAQGANILVVGPGVIGLLEPGVRAMVNFSKILRHLHFFQVGFVQDSMEAFKDAIF
ncbi:unnamed protein product [Ascophyllum nodosum]